jgi:HPt (histidine-containing phosphotransfer) domain-containing protein
VDLDEFRSSMRAAGIEEVVEPILALFAQEGPKGVASISAALSAGDMEGVRRAAHSLKSSAGNIRAKALAELLQQLENAAEARDSRRVVSLAESVGLEHDAVLKYLAPFGAGT